MLEVNTATAVHSQFFVWGTTRSEDASILFLHHRLYFEPNFVVDVSSAFGIQSTSVITSLQGQNALCRYKRGSLKARYMGKVKERYFTLKIQPEGTLLNVCTVIFFRSGLQLKLRNNKDFSSVIVNFLHSFTLKHTLTQNWY